MQTGKSGPGSDRPARRHSDGFQRYPGVLHRATAASTSGRRRASTAAASAAADGAPAVGHQLRVE